MKILCDVCEKAAATVICCADEAALCDKCDVEVHSANKLASKHQRLSLQCLSRNLPSCDICQEKAAFIFCVEDRALFCKDCDEPIHSASNLTKSHQRYLATGIRVALSSSCDKGSLEGQVDRKPPKPNPQPSAFPIPSHHVSDLTSQSWAVDELLQFPDSEIFDKKEQLESSELEWLTGINLFSKQAPHEASAPAEVPQLSTTQQSSMVTYRPPIYYAAQKKPRTEIPEDDEQHFIVPDLAEPS